MGGGGGGYSLDSRELKKLREEARERFETAQAESDINSFLGERLVEINARDVDAVDRHLDAVEEVLSDRIKEFDRLRFGGSVAKHTYVDGFSDIDSLVVLDDPTLDPAQARQELARALETGLQRGDVASIETGFAVTVNFRDGTKLQLLPAIERGREVAISSPDGSIWIDIHPRGFARTLTEVNKAQSGRVVPVVKLAKSVMAGLPVQQRPSGYHMEALAVAAFTNYNGSRALKDMLAHLFRSAATDVRRPIPDVTGQSRHVDESLGAAESVKRQRISRRLTDLARTMETSVSLNEWRSLIE